jgi:PKD repeat protein
MTPPGARRWLLAVLAVILLASVCAAPACAGNTVAISGRILPPPAPVAQFSGSPLSGTAPLVVALDASSSTGTITSYAWDFDNDGTTDFTSASATTSHTYGTAGSYTVKLTVTGPGGSDDETKTSFITVTAAPVVHDIYWVADKPMGVVPGGAMEFRVTGAWSTIAHKSRTYSLKIGDTVRLVTGSDRTGQIYATSSFISTFAFDNVRLYINGVDKGTGTVRSIWISGYDSFSSTLALDAPSRSAWTQFVVDGTSVIYGTDNSQVQISGIRPWAGVMNLDTGSSYSYFDGGADSYLVTPVVTPPVAAFSATPTSGTAPLAVQFTDTSTNTPTSWKWEYQKSGTSSWTQFSTSRHPTYTFATKGSYSIRLTATNAAGSDAEMKTGFITVGSSGPVVAYFTGSPTSGNRPLTVQFTDGSSGSVDNWAWDFENDGIVDSTMQHPAKTYSAKGYYSVRLTVSNSCCTSTAIRYNYINVKK